ncbi:MAG: molecular chaperone HscC [Pseudohongiellaceae bacterium]|jgi:molecular chaperone HscC
MYMIGIDLGTTNSLAAYWKDGEPLLVANALKQVMTPSVVGIDGEGQVIVGEVAKQRLQTHPDLTTANFKRYMGADKQIKLGRKKFRPSP